MSTKSIYLREATLGELLAEVSRRFEERNPLPEWAAPVVLTVATYYGFQVEQLRSRQKDDAVARSRHLCIALLAELFPARSRAEVCAVLGVEHHMYAHALRRIEERVCQFADFRAEVREIHGIIRETTRGTGQTGAATCGEATRNAANGLPAA